MKNCFSLHFHAKAPFKLFTKCASPDGKRLQSKPHPTAVQPASDCSPSQRLIKVGLEFSLVKTLRVTLLSLSFRYVKSESGKFFHQTFFFGYKKLRIPQGETRSVMFVESSESERMCGPYFTNCSTHSLRLSSQ